MKKALLLLLSLLSGTDLIAGPYTYFDVFSGNRDCNTSGLYDSKTRASFFGDSRIHLADGRLAPLIKLDVYAFGNPAGLDFFLRGAGDDWNVQNLASSGMMSGQLDDFLNGCLKNENFKIHENVAFHIGGNDFLAASLLLKVFPWKYGDVVNLVANNHERIISRFQRRNKKILLIGQYPAIAYSTQRGPAHLWFSNFRHLLAACKDTPAVPCSYSFKDGLAQFGASLQSGLDRLANLLGLSGENEYRDLSYEAWVERISDPATVASLGLWFLEHGQIPEMVHRRRTHGAEIDHIYLWHTMVWWSGLGGTNEVWIANRDLMADRLHPNPYGFWIWGQQVGHKMKAMGWQNSTFDVATQTVIDVDDTTPVPGEVVNRPSNPEPSVWDWIILCYFLKICK